MKRAITIIVVLIALAGLGYYGYRQVQRARANAAGAYKTVPVTRGDLTASVGATGTVRANQSAAINWQLTGQIGEVKVAVGDIVQANQELARLAEKSLPQSVILARADLVTARRNLDQLQNSQVASAKAYQTMVTAQKELDDAKKARESKNYARASDATIDEARANLVVAGDAVTKATELYDKFDSRPEDDPMRAEAFSQLAKARQQRDRALANLNWLLGRPDNQELSQADARVQVAEASLNDAQREWERLKNGPDQSDVDAAKAKVTAVEAVLDQVTLEAPFTGTVTDVNIKPGDQVAPGASAFHIDDLSKLLVSVQVTEVDINRIRVGEPAMMTFDAIPEKEYSGKVSEVSRVGAPVQGVVNFEVTIQLENADGAVRPGMTAGINIVTDLVENVLLIPNRAVRLLNGKRVVYVLRNGVPVMTQVQLGLTSDTESQVLGGDIKEGDQLVLNPPVQFNPSGGPRGGFGGGGGGGGAGGGGAGGGAGGQGQ